ncbi:HisA/HisF-related TIM barrel protein [Streptomyces sp. NPDC003379]
MCARIPIPVLAAGGIRHLEDLRDVTAHAPHGVAGAVIGRALYTGALSFPKARLLCTRRRLVWRLGARSVRSPRGPIHARAMPAI